MNKEDSILTTRDYVEICKENEYLLTVHKDLRNQVEKLTGENQQLKNNWNELKEYLEKILEESCVPLRQYYAEHFSTIMQEIY